MDKKRIILLCAMGLLLAAAIALGVAWVIEANEYAGYEADYVDALDIYAHHVCALYERTRSRCGQQ